MKLSTTAIAVALTGLLPACTGEIGGGPSLPEEGLQIEDDQDTHFSGTYRVADAVVTFEAMVDGSETFIQISDLYGNELVLVEKDDATEQVRMHHYGVELDMQRGDQEQPSVAQWIASEEAQLVASLWRDIVDTPTADRPAAKAMMEYGIHLDEVFGKMVAVANGEQPADGFSEDAAHRCTDCGGKCGPGCWSIGSLWYCRMHDCCCDHYGGWACYTWCLAYPKCGHSGSCY